MIDDRCSIEPTTNYVYLSSRTRTFVPLDVAAVTDPDKRPADLASTNLPGGAVQPFIVRVDTLTINRGIAQIAMLAGVDGAVSGWNNKLIYAFGGRCGAGYRQGTRAVEDPVAESAGPGVRRGLQLLECAGAELQRPRRGGSVRDDPRALHRGPRVAGVHDGDRLLRRGRAGVPDRRQLSRPARRPGRRLQPGRHRDPTSLSWPSTPACCSSYANTHPGRLTPQQLVTVSGLSSVEALAAMSRHARILDPVAGFTDDAVPAAARYSASNPRGARATVWDQTANVYGVTGAGGPGPSTARQRRRPVRADRAAAGPDHARASSSSSTPGSVAWTSTSGRPDTEPLADAQATRAAYASGRVLNGGGGLSNLPIIDYRSYGYGPSTMPLDLGHHTFVVQERLRAANGDADNMVILADSGHGRFALERGAVAESIEQMDRWLTALHASPYRGHRAAVTASPPTWSTPAGRPTDARSPNRRPTGAPVECAQRYPAHATPRMVAGGPLTSDVISCTLKPVRPRDYPATLTRGPAQAAGSDLPRGRLRLGPGRPGPAQS